jgi:hypothetical protein
MTRTQGATGETSEPRGDDQQQAAPAAEPAPPAEPTPAERRSDSYLIGF